MGRHLGRYRSIMSSADENFADFQEQANYFLNSQRQPYLKTFSDMWYKIFLTALFSSIFIHTVSFLKFNQSLTFYFNLTLTWL